MEIWSNTLTYLFVVEDGGFVTYLRCTGIRDIEWITTEEGEGSCQYCGAAMEGDECSGCGNAALPIGEHSFGRAVVMLEGVLPQALPIFHLPEGAELLLCHKCHGDCMVYDAREVIMRFLHCHQVAKNMPDVAVLYSEQEDRLRLFVSVECEVEMYPEGMGSRGGM